MIINKVYGSVQSPHKFLRTHRHTLHNTNLFLSSTRTFCVLCAMEVLYRGWTKVRS
jgi:hypothetical protein